MLSTAGMLITYHGYHLHMLTNMFDVIWFTLYMFDVVWFTL